MTPVSYVKTAACRLIDAHIIALILLSACGTIFVRKHCSHEEYGLGARGRIYGAAKVHHAGFSPACGSWDEAKVSEDKLCDENSAREEDLHYVHPHSHMFPDHA